MSKLNFDKVDLNTFSSETESNVYDIVEESKKQQLNASVSEAVKINPDKQANLNKLSRESGVPVEAVEGGEEEIQTGIRLREIDTTRLQKEAPKTANLLSDYQKASIAHDDVKTLEDLEKVLKRNDQGWFGKTFENMGQTIGLGFDQQAAGLLLKGTDKTATRIEDLIDPSALPLGVQDAAPFMSMELAGNLGINNNDDLEKAKEEATLKLINDIVDIQKQQQELTPEDLSTLQQGVRGGIESLAVTSPGLLMSIASRNPIPMLASAGVQSYGSSYGEGRSAGLSESDASNYASIMGGLEVLTELIPAKKTTELLRLDGGLKGKLLSFMIGDMAGEQVNTFLGTVTDVAYDLDEQLANAETIEEKIQIQAQRQLVTAISTVVASGTQAGALGTLNYTLTKLAEKEQVQDQKSQVEQSTLEKINELSTNSKLKQRDEEAFKQFINEIDGENDTQVFIDAVQAKLYMADKDVQNDPALKALNDRISEAAALGGELAIPVADFAATIAGTEHFDALKDFMTLSQDTISPYRQEQAREETRSYIDSIMQEANENVSQYVESQEIFESVRDQLVDTGMVNTQNANVMAQVVPAWAAVYAARNNISVKEAYVQSGLIIEGPQTGRKDALLDDQIEPVKISDKEIQSRIVNREQPEEVQVETERRSDDVRRERISAMSPEEQYAAIYTNELTGLNNRRAFEEDLKTSPVVVSIDVDSLKAVNDNLGHDAGDQLLKIAGKAIHEATGGKAYHISGDEFYVLGDNQQQIEQALEKAKKSLQSSKINTERGRMTGVDFTYGVGFDKKAADQAMEKAKSDREARGERVARGEMPKGMEVNQKLKQGVALSVENKILQDTVFEREVDYKTFAEAIAKAKQDNPQGAFVYQYPDEEYKGMKLYLGDNGLVGFAIKEDGDLVSVFKHPDSSVKGAIEQIVPTAVALGATKLDAFEGFLTANYSKFGFVEVGRDKWSDEFAPVGWNYERDGKPDVVYMELKKDGTAFRDFFSSVTTGQGGKASKSNMYTPVVFGMDQEIKNPESDLGKYHNEYMSHKGNFDDHIALSIPGYRDFQYAIGDAILKTFDNGVMLDIGASEGTQAKTITSLSNGNIKSISLDPNPDMKSTFETRSSVPGAEYSMTALGITKNDKGVAWKEDDGTEIKYFDDKGEKFDIVQEAMVFQFIDRNRPAHIKRIAELTSDDGIAVIQEKVLTENWDANEKKKNEAYKSKYFAKKDLDAKAAEVLEGMNKNMVSQEELESILRNNFKFVEQIWDSGNFKGYVASNSEERIQKFTGAMVDTRTPFDTRVSFSQSAFHGTPHTFDKFSLEAIGSGEGAQAFGWGLYFAGKKGIAEFYKDTVGYKEIVRKFRNELPDDADIDELMELVESGELDPKTEGVLKALNNDDWLGFDYPSQAINAAFRNIDEYDPSPELVEAVNSYSNVYQVNIPEDSELMSWDNPISEQPEIMKKLQIKEKQIYLDTDLTPDMSGQQIYDRLSRGLTNRGVTGKREASQYLSSLGIPGLRYFDSPSRDKGEGSQNYVIWDEDRVTVEAVNDELRQAERFSQSSLGMYSAVERALQTLRLPQWKKEDGEARGQDVWNKIKSEPGIKKEELEWLGLEEFLTVDPEVKFTRAQVIQYVEENGVKVEEVTATEQKDESEIEWYSPEVWDNEEAYSHRIEDYMYDYDNGESDWFDKESWLIENIEEVVENYKTTLDEDALSELEEYDGDASSQLYVIRNAGYIPEDDFDSQMREAAEEQATEMAKSEYADNPVYIQRSQDFPDGSELIIFGNDDQGYDIRTGMSYNNVVLSDIWSLSEAEIQAQQYAIENDLLNDTKNTEQVKWEDYVTEGDYENYREIKLTLPDIQGDFYNEVHFPDRNLLAFMRVSDRELVSSEFKPREKLNVEVRIVDNPIENAVVKRIAQVVNVDTGEVINTAAPDFSKYENEQAVIDQVSGKLKEPGVRYNYKGRNFVVDVKGELVEEFENTKKTFFIEEFQSDWHQKGRQKGYQSDFDIDSFDYEVDQYEKEVVEPLLDDVMSLYQQLISQDSLIEEGQKDNNNEHLLIKYGVDGGYINSLVKVPFKEELINRVSEIVNKFADDNLKNRYSEYVEKAKYFREGFVKKQEQREGVVNAPFKGNEWLNLGLKRSLILAAENDYDAVAWPNAQVLMDRWSSNYESLYKTQYDTKMVSMMKKLTKQQPKQFALDDFEPILSFQEFKKMLKVKSVPEDSGYGVYVGYDKEAGKYSESAEQLSIKLGFDTEQEALDWVNKLDSYPVETVDQGYHIVELTPELKKQILENSFSLFQTERGYYEPNRSLIRLNEAADLSTFLHEFAHFMYEMELKAARTSPNVSNLNSISGIHNWYKRNAKAVAQEAEGYLHDQVTPDFTVPPVTITEDDVVVYLDNDTTGDINKDVAIRRAVHEQFARGFETYLMEGKAPSVELRNAFRTFARWLVQIYKAVRGNLRVRLDDDMRKVFDRLLATEEQIAAAEARNQYKAMFPDAETANMTPAEFENYKKQQEKIKDKQTETLRDKMIEEITRTTKQWWKEEKQDVIDEELEKLRNEKVYRAINRLRDGEFKLDRATVKEMVGTEQTDKRGRTSTRIPGKLNGMHVPGAKGVHPDEAAAFLGYESGAEMLNDIINAEPIGEVAATRAEQVMLDRHGDILNDGTIEQQADEAVQNEERGKLLLQELKALRANTSAPKMDRATVKAIAEERIAKLSYRDIHPGKYRKAELKAAQEAAVAFAKGDRETAARAKAQQIMNYYLGMEATAARNNVIKIVDRMGRYNKKKVREEIQKAENGYWEQIVKILNRFEFRKSASLKRVDEVNQDINTWMKERIDQDGDGLVLSPAVLNETYVTHWKNVPYSDLQSIDDSVKNIEHVARYGNKLNRMGEEIEFRKLVDRWVNHMNESPTRFTAQRTDVVKGRSWGRWAMAQMTKIPFMASWLDGGERVGLSHQILVQPFTNAAQAEIRLWGEVGNVVLQAIEGRSKEDRKRHNRKVFIPEIKTAIEDGNLMGHQIIAVALNTGNQSNLRKMLLGEGWANPENPDEISMDNPKLKAVLKHMTKSDWQLVQLIWDQMDLLYPRLAEVHRRTTGLTPPKVEATPVETPHGTFRGGYYPVKYDPNRSHEAEMNEEKLNALTESMFATIGSIQASVNASATNERTKYYAPIRLSLDVVPSHFQEVIHYITHHDAVREVNKLIRNKQVANTIKAKIGPEEYAQLKPWLNDLAKDGREAPTKMFWDDMLSRLRFGLTLGTMGFKASTGLIQISGMSNTIAEVGLKPVLQAARSVLGSVTTMREAWEFAKSNSKVLEHRAQTMDREIKNAMNKLTGKRGMLAAVQEASMKHIALIQTYMVDLPSWHAAYIKEMENSGDEQKAYQYADWVIENVQGSGATKDLARIMRNQSETGRMFTMFMTFFSSLWNMERDLVKGARSGRYSVTTTAAKAAFLFTIPVLFEMLLRGELGGSDDDEESTIQQVLTKTALYPLQSVPFLRDIVNGTAGEYGYNMSPIASVIESGTRSIPAIAEAALTDDEITKAQAKGASKVVGASFGIPGVNQAWATGEHLYEVVEEGEEFTVREFLFGPDRD